MTRRPSRSLLASCRSGFCSRPFPLPPSDRFTQQRRSITSANLAPVTANALFGILHLGNFVRISPHKKVSLADASAHLNCKSAANVDSRSIGSNFAGGYVIAGEVCSASAAAARVMHITYALFASPGRRAAKCRRNTFRTAAASGEWRVARIRMTLNTTAARFRRNAKSGRVTSMGNRRIRYGAARCCCQVKQLSVALASITASSPAIECKFLAPSSSSDHRLRSRLSVIRLSKSLASESDSPFRSLCSRRHGAGARVGVTERAAGLAACVCASPRFVFGPERVCEKSVAETRRRQSWRAGRREYEKRRKRRPHSASELNEYDECA